MSTNGELIISYLEWVKTTRGRSAATVRSYGSTLSSFDEWLGQRHALGLRPEDLEDWLGRPSRWGGRRAAASQAHDVAVLKQFYEYHINRGNLTLNPAKLLGSPRVHNVNPRPIPDHEWTQLWDSTAHSLYERTAFGLGFFCGLRRAEITSIQPGMIDLFGRRLVGFTRKGGGDDIMPWGDCCDVLERLAVRADEFAATLTECLDSRPACLYLLPWGNPDVMNTKMRRAVRVAGVPESHTPHSLRHSFVSNLLRANVPLHLVQRLANHSNPTVTMRYVRAGGAELKSWLRDQPRA